MADAEFADGDVLGPTQPQAGEPHSGLEEVVVEVGHALGEGVGAIIEAVHDLTATPVDLANEHVEHVNELHVAMMEALSRGDVDTASALNLQAESELNAAVDHLHDPDYRASHHAEGHFDAQATPIHLDDPAAMPPAELHPPVPHVGDEFGA